MAVQSIAYLQSLIRELSKLPSETEWVEFKSNYQEPQMIGEYISALSNSATLWGKPKGYLVWGINWLCLVRKKGSIRMMKSYFQLCI